MPIAQAGEMVQASSAQPGHRRGVLIRPQDLHRDQESLEQIASSFQRDVSPVVAIEALDDKPWAGHPRHQSESLLCDISGVAHLFGGEIGLLKAAAGVLETMGLQGRMAIADSVGAAWGLSHYGSLHQEFCIAAPGDSQRKVESLPVQSLRLSAETVATLSRLGIERVDQLLRLPRSGLAERLGGSLVRRISQLIGQVDEPLGVYRAAPEHSQTLVLEYPTSDGKILADRIERLMQKIRAGLATCQRGALRMTCRLGFSAHPPLSLNVGLFAPTIDADHLSGLMISRLETLKLPACVERLTLSVTLSGPLRSSQSPLFDCGSVDGNAFAAGLSGSAVSRLIDSLSGRLGRDAVVGVKLADDPLPEKAFAVSPLAGNSVSSGKPVSSVGIKTRKISIGSTSGVREPSPDDALRRPLSLLAEPVPLAVASEDAPFCWFVSSAQLPSRLRLDGVIHQVTAHWGPERIETGWWRGPSTRRDYYRIETDQGRWWWIFRNLVSKKQAADDKCYRWMLHGRFA
jgi:protein ImuB